MATDYIESAKALRDAAWRDVQTSPAYLAFKLFDDAVAGMGGERIVADVEPSPDRPRPSIDTFKREKRRRTVSNRISQPDAAETALRQYGEPLMTLRLMEWAQEKGASVGGANPLANFRSALSKDERFYSQMRNGAYFWWLTGVPLPNGWNNETPDLPLEDGPGASSHHSNQEGGEADATATS